jgi:hypothetical protein
MDINFISALSRSTRPPARLAIRGTNDPGLITAA